MKSYLIYSTLLLALAPASRGAGVELLLGGHEQDHLIAIDHTSPEQIRPAIHHHHHAERTDRLEFEFSLGADSRYVTEGRDNLAGEGGILWGSASGHLHVLEGSIFGNILGIQAWESDFQEIDLAVGYEREFGPVTVVGAVTYLWFPQEDGDDDDVEFALGAEWVCESGVGLAAEVVWSTEAEGAFGELQLFYEWEVCECFKLVPSVILGLNQGFVADEHDGLNHVAFQLEGAIPLTEHLEASAFVSFAEPLDEEDGEILRDLFWFGGAVTATF